MDIHPTFTLTWNNGKVCTIKKSYCHDRKKYEEKGQHIPKYIFQKCETNTYFIFSMRF